MEDLSVQDIISGVIYLAIFILAIYGLFRLRKRNLSKANAILEGVGKHTADFKFGRVHGFIAEGKLFVQEGALIKVNVIDLSLALYVTFDMNTSTYATEVWFKNKDNGIEGSAISFTMQKQAREFVNFVKQYASWINIPSNL